LEQNTKENGPLYFSKYVITSKKVE